MIYAFICNINTYLKRKKKLVNSIQDYKNIVFQIMYQSHTLKILPFYILKSLVYRQQNKLLQNLIPNKIKRLLNKKKTLYNPTIYQSTATY
jgi:hypothetical protein